MEKSELARRDCRLFLRLNCRYICTIYLSVDFNITTYISGGVALIVTPIVSLLTVQSNKDNVEKIWKARKLSEEEIR